MSQAYVVFAPTAQARAGCYPRERATHRECTKISTTVYRVGQNGGTVFAELPHTAQRTMNDAHCTMQNAHAHACTEASSQNGYRLHNAQCTVHNEQCRRHKAQCTRQCPMHTTHNAQCTVHSRCTMQNAKCTVQDSFNKLQYLELCCYPTSPVPDKYCPIFI